MAMICLTSGSGLLVAQTPDADTSAEEQKEKVAAERFLDLLIKKPAAGTALDRVFGYHVERGTISNLIGSLTQTAQKSTKDDEAGRHWLLVGLLQLQRGEDAQAVEALAKSQQLLKDNPLAAFHHGQALLLVGNTEGAATAFEAAITRKPTRNDYLNIARELGRLYQRSGKTDDALRIWNDLEKNFPGDDTVRQRIAATLVEEGDIAGALARYVAMAKAAKAENDRIAFALDAARLRSQLGEKEQALKDFDALLAKVRPGSYLYDEARRRIENIFLTSGDYAGLSQYYEAWLKGHPDDLSVILRSARTLSLQGRSGEAIERFEQAIERAPNDESVRLACIDAYIAANRFADAATQFEALIKANPKNPDYLVRYGQVLLSDTQKLEADRAKAAAEVWRRLTEAKPKDAAVHSQVADLLRGAKLSEEAIANYRKAISLAPDDPQHKEYLGEYLHQLKRTDEAMAVWRTLAEGNARNLDNLVRLAEVYHQFEQPAEALKVMEQACQEKPKVIHRLRYVEWLCDAKEFDKANTQLELARKEADNTEDRSRIFTASVKAYQMAGKLEEQIKQATTVADSQPNVGENWRQLAMLHEANNNPAEALKAIEKAVTAESNSIETLDIASRMNETGGRIPEAIALRKRLIDIDRRFRSAHLQRLATLYVTNSQPDVALATGKELLASAGGAIDAFRFYANLCGQLGRDEERLDTLRRCLRLNPRSMDAIEMLANQLAEEFKTDQAIELVWKQLDLAEDIAKRREVVKKLTDLYLRSNRLDQLVSRLEIRGRESNDRRTAIDLVATVYQQAGDLGLARETLEGLLQESGRDTLLMERLGELAQQAGEVDRAIELQRELVRLAPGKQSESRLASLLIDIGATEEAQSLWLSSVDIRADTSPIVRALDQLFMSGEYKAAYDLASKVLDANPSDWDMLTRRIALAALADEWEMATKDSQALLAMNIADEEESAIVKKRNAKNKNSLNSQNPQYSQAVYPQNYPIQLQNIQNTQQLWMLLDPRYGMQLNALPAADTFGAAKSIANMVLVKRAEDDGKGDEVLEQSKTAAMASTATAKDVWRWYEISQLLSRTRSIGFEDFRDPETWQISWRLFEVDPTVGQYVLGNQLSTRQYNRGPNFEYKPLSEQRLQWLKERVAKAKESQPARGYSINWTGIYANELSIAGKKEEAEQVRKQRSKQPLGDDEQIYEALALIAEEGNDDELWSGIQKANEQNKIKPQPFTTATNRAAGLLGMFVSQERIEKKLSPGPSDATYRQRVWELFDAVLTAEASQSNRGKSIRLTSIGGPRQTYRFVKNNYQQLSIEFPPQGLGPDDEFIRTFYQVWQEMKDYSKEWISHLSRDDPNMDGRLKIESLASAAYLEQWSDRTDRARELLEQALTVAKEKVPQQESSFRLLLADLLLRLDRKKDALAMIDQLSVYDQNTMAIREFAAARLSSVLGDKARAEQAARRLIGVRLDAESQIELAKLLRSLEMNDLAADVVRRMRGRTGNSTTQLRTLLTYFQSQNDKESTSQAAMEILQRTTPTPKRSGGGMTMDQALRNQALQALATNGQLTGVIENTKKRLERAPGSQRIRAELVEMYRVTGQVQELDALLNKDGKDGKAGEQKLESTAALEASAKQLTQAQKWSEASDAYLKVLRRNPKLLAQDFYEIEQPFSQCKRLGDLADLMMEVGLQKFESYRVSEVVERLIRNEKNIDKARQLFLKIASDRKSQSSFYSALNNVSSDLPTLIDSEEILLTVLEGVINDSRSKAGNNQWTEMFSGYSTHGDGRKDNGTTSLIQFVAGKPALAEVMDKRLREAIEANDKWREGKVCLALLQVANKKYDQARPELEAIIEKPLDGGRETLWLIGSFVDKHPPLYDLAERMYEVALKEQSNNYNDDFQYSLHARVCQFMVDRDKKPRAREILLAAIAQRNLSDRRGRYGNAQYEAYMAVRDTMGLLKYLNLVDAPAEALKMARKFDRKNFALSAQYGSSSSEAAFDKQVQEIEASLRRLGGTAVLESMIDAEAKGPHAVEFGITASDRPFTDAGLKSLWLEMCIDSQAKPESTDGFASFMDRLKKLRETRPDDESVRLALALATSREGDKELLDAYIESIPTNTKAADAANGKTTTSAQWHALAYSRWFGLQHASPAAVVTQADVEATAKWLSNHAEDWPAATRATLIAGLGKLALTQKQTAIAAGLWELCLNQPRMTQWLITDLTVAAARADMTDLAVRGLVKAAKAVDQAPGDERAKTNSLGELLGAQQRLMANMGNRSTDLDDNAKSMLASRLIEIDDIWTNKKLDGKLLIDPFSAWIGVSEKQMQPWAVKFQGVRDNQWKLESVIDRLARRAHACGQTESLVEALLRGIEKTDADSLAGTDPSRIVAIALAWLRNEQGDKAAPYFKALNATRLSTIHRTAALQLLMTGLDNKDCRTSAAELAIAWAKANRPTERYAAVTPFDSLTLEIVRKSIQQHWDKELRSSAIALYLELCQHENDRYSGSTRITQSAGQFESIAQMFLNADQSAEALQYLGQRQAAFNQGGDRDDDWVGSWMLENINSKTNRQEAYQLLSDWTFQGDSNLNSIRAFSRRAPLPAWIPEDVGGKYPNFAPMVDKSVPLVTSFYSLALLSTEVQQTEPLLARYQAALEQKRAGADVGLAITLAALKRPVPEELLKEMQERLISIKPSEGTNEIRVAAPLAELQLALILNANKQNGQWVKDTVAQVARHGANLGRTYLSPWLARYEYQQGWSSRQSLQPLIQPKHWSLSTSAAAKEYYEGKTPAMWLTDGKDQLYHVCGHGADWVWWRYPLEGNFEFEFETQESDARGIEFYIAGLRFAVYPTYLDITSEDTRDWIRLSAELDKDKPHKHTVTLDDKELKYAIDGKPIYSEPRQPGAVSLALRSTGTYQAYCRNIKFSGNPRIAKSVTMLPADHLRGWSGYFYGQNLPSSKMVSPTAASENQNVRVGTSLTDRANLTWTIADGELISGEGRTSGPGDQLIIQAMRPMTAGDKLEYEFYYEPDKYEVHPAMGRTAFLLKPAGIERHWLTEPNSSWKTPNDNHFPIEGAAALSLQAGQWNKVSLELKANQLVISVNGGQPLELPWQTEGVDGMFGLFCVKGQTQARVRNIVLTGQWPTEMPTVLFEK